MSGCSIRSMPRPIVESVAKTRRLCVVDGGWRTAGFAAEIFARVVRRAPLCCRAAPAVRITLPDAPAPTSAPLEAIYYPSVATIVDAVVRMLAR